MCKYIRILFDTAYQIDDNVRMNIQDYTNFLLSNGWTQVEIAQEIGVSQPTVAAIVKGHSNIRASAADRLKKLFVKARRRAKRAA